MSQSAKQMTFGSCKSLDERVELDDRCAECSGTKKSLCLTGCSRAVSADIQIADVIVHH